MWSSPGERSINVNGRESGAGALRVVERAVLGRRSGAAAGGDPRAGADELPRRGGAGLRDRGQWVRGGGRPLARRHGPHGPLVGFARALFARAASAPAPPRARVLPPKASHHPRGCRHVACCVVLCEYLWLFVGGRGSACGPAPSSIAGPTATVGRPFLTDAAFPTADYACHPTRRSAAYRLEQTGWVCERVDCFGAFGRQLSHVARRAPGALIPLRATPLGAVTVSWSRRGAGRGVPGGVADGARGAPGACHVRVGGRVARLVVASLQRGAGLPRRAPAPAPAPGLHLARPPLIAHGLLRGLVHTPREPTLTL